MKLKFASVLAASLAIAACIVAILGVSDYSALVFAVTSVTFAILSLHDRS